MNFLKFCDQWFFPDKNRLKTRFQEISSRKFFFSRLWDEGRYDELYNALDTCIEELEELKKQASGHSRLSRSIEFKISRLLFRKNEISQLMLRKAEKKPEVQLSLIKTEEVEDRDISHLD